jgi:hypothetical protein
MVRFLDLCYGLLDCKTCFSRGFDIACPTRPTSIFFLCRGVKPAQWAAWYLKMGKRHLATAYGGWRLTCFPHRWLEEAH